MRIRRILTVVLIISAAVFGSGAAKRRSVRHPGPAGPLPIAVSDSYSTTEGINVVIAAPGVLANDTLNQAAIVSYGVNGIEQSALGSSTPTAQGGSVTLRADGGFVYFAAAGFVGADTFRYALTSSSGSSSATVTIDVLPSPPSAANDGFNTAQNTALSAPAPGVFANDALHGAALASYGASTGVEQSAIGTTTPTTANGTVRMSADGAFVYTPATGFSGSDSFKYVVQNAGGTSTATVTITVQSAGPDFIVTTPGFFYAISGLQGQNPVLTLKRGRTYTFDINAAPEHPFEILGAPAGSVTNNNISDGIITFNVPATAQNYQYICSIHGFGNTINTVP